MVTHQDYKISRWSADEALVRFYEGGYQDVRDELTGETVSTYVRTGRPREVLYTFDGDCTFESLRAFLDDKLNTEGRMTSIPEQVRKRAPSLAVRA